MGLNDDVDEGLEPEVIPEINENQPIGNEIVFIPNKNMDSKEDQEKEPTTQELFGVGAVERELPNLNAVFNLSKEHYYKIVDLFSYKKTLNKINCICKEDAEVIDSIAPGFINEKNPIGFFTEDRSRTQYSESMNNINVALDNKYNNLLESVNKSIETYHTNISPLVTKMNDGIIDSFIKAQENIVNTSEKVGEINVSAIDDLNNFLGFNTGNNFDNENTLPGMEKISAFLNSPKNKQNLKTIVDFKLLGEENTFLFTKSFNDCFYKVEDDKPFLNKTDIHPNDLSEPSFYKVMCNGASSYALSYCSALVGCARNLLTDIMSSKEVIDSLNTEETDFKNKLDRLFVIHSENTNSYLNIISILTFVCNYIDFINDFSNAINVLLTSNK